MNIGTLRRRLFIPVDHEWNGIVRDITARYEHSGEEVDEELVCAAMARFYRDRATISLLREHLGIVHRCH
jgi:hypothetical protein